MFQMMVDCESIDDIYTWYDMVKSDAISFFANPRGHLGASLDFEQLKENIIDSATIGSVCFKFLHEGKNISVLVFKSGKIKISGGYPMHIIAANTVAVYDTYLDEIATHVQNITKLTCGNKNISCLNGQLYITPMQNTTELAAFVQTHRHKFAYIKQPQYDVPGRRGAYKLYLKNSTKTHVAVDIKGKAQIFAAKTFVELISLFHIFD